MEKRKNPEKGLYMWNEVVDANGTVRFRKIESLSEIEI